MVNFSINENGKSNNTNYKLIASFSWSSDVFHFQNKKNTLELAGDKNVSKKCNDFQKMI